MSNIIEFKRKITLESLNVIKDISSFTYDDIQTRLRLIAQNYVDHVNTEPMINTLSIDYSGTEVLAKHTLLFDFGNGHTLPNSQFNKMNIIQTNQMNAVKNAVNKYKFENRYYADAIVLDVLKIHLLYLSALEWLGDHLKREAMYSVLLHTNDNGDQLEGHQLPSIAIQLNKGVLYIAKGIIITSAEDEDLDNE